MLAGLLFLTILYLAYMNGANDNVKSVASIYGAELISVKTALFVAHFTSFLGSFSAILCAQFYLPEHVMTPFFENLETHFLLVMTFTAALLVHVNTQYGLPISSTIIVLSSCMGAAFIAMPENFFPLALDNALLLTTMTLVSFLLSFFVYGFLKLLQKKLIGTEVFNSLEEINRPHSKLYISLHLFFVIAVTFLRAFAFSLLLSVLFFLSNEHNIEHLIYAITLIMFLGGILHSKRVLMTMKEKVLWQDPLKTLCINVTSATTLVLSLYFGYIASLTFVMYASIVAMATLTKTFVYKRVIKIFLLWHLMFVIACFISAYLYWIIA